MKFWSPSLLLVFIHFGVCCSLGQDIRIASAYYGPPNEVGVDVTHRVQRFADYGEPFRVGNDTLSIDPSPSHQKALVVIYKVNGRQISDCVQEGGVFYFRDGEDSSSAPGESKPAVRIIQALYGAKEHYVDVTGHVRQLARDRQTFTVSNDTFGIDPFHGRQKWLKIFYLRGDEHRKMQYAEGDQVQLQ
jgi:hypothetical protein